MSNLEIYEKYRNPPQEALKPIKGGRLSGMTDINPMWRIKALTEQFGACGTGWYYTVDEQKIIDCGEEKIAIVNISLFHKIGEEWSKPVYGTGGAKLIAKEKSGLFVSDEAFKMATTDALSVACKQFGFAADIYWQGDATKYNTSPPKEHDETREKRKEIMGLLKKTGVTEETLCATYQVRSVGELKGEALESALKKLKATAEKNGK